jgi:hypothetical protein
VEEEEDGERHRNNNNNNNHSDVSSFYVVELDLLFSGVNLLVFEGFLCGFAEAVGYLPDILENPSAVQRDFSLVMLLYKAMTTDPSIIGKITTYGDTNEKKASHSQKSYERFAELLMSLFTDVASMELNRRHVGELLAVVRKYAADGRGREDDALFWFDGVPARMVEPVAMATNKYAVDPSSAVERGRLKKIEEKEKEENEKAEENETREGNGEREPREIEKEEGNGAATSLPLPAHATAEFSVSNLPNVPGDQDSEFMSAQSDFFSNPEQTLRLIALMSRLTDGQEGMPQELQNMLGERMGTGENENHNQDGNDSEEDEREGNGENIEPTTATATTEESNNPESDFENDSVGNDGESDDDEHQPRAGLLIHCCKSITKEELAKNVLAGVYGVDVTEEVTLCSTEMDLFDNHICALLNNPELLDSIFQAIHNGVRPEKVMGGL